MIQRIRKNMGNRKKAGVENILQKLKRSSEVGKEGERAKKRKKRSTSKKDTMKETSRAEGSAPRPTSTHDGDDDFVSKVRLTKAAVSEIKRKGAQKNEKVEKEMTKDKNEKNPSNINGIRTRTSPKTLHETVKLLKEEQRTAVEAMGLGSLLNMTVDGVPSKLGYFVVDNLDTERMQLNLRVNDINR